MAVKTQETNTALWTGEEIAEAVGGDISGSFSVDGIQIDSRVAGNGDLFVAIRGEFNDGHDYLDQTVAANATGFLVEDKKDLKENTIVVENSFKALWDLAKAARARLTAQTIGITGSVGKTGTKELLIKAFEAVGITNGTVGNLNNHYGLPLTLTRLPKETEYVILEMGMSAPEEIRPLSELAQPHIGIITAIAAAHSEFFDSIEEIALAKSEIFDGLLPNGTAILNRDDDHFEFLAALLSTNRPDCKLLTFGSNASSDAQLLSSTFDQSTNTQRISAHICGTKVDYELSLTGQHWALNSLAALLSVHAAGGNVEKAAGKLTEVLPLSGRGQLLSCSTANDQEFTLIDESYNASPAAVEAAIRTLAQLGEGKRTVLVLGDMRELGAQSSEMHAELASTVVENDIDLVFTSGSDSKALLEAVPRNLVGCHKSTAIELKIPLLEALQAGDIVLIKGSLGSKMSPLVTALKGS